jgi:hypothetical protein
VAREVAIEAADCFAVSLAIGGLAGDVVTGLGVAAGARDGDAVNRRVDLAVAAAVEPVAAGLARADGDRRNAGGAGELGVAGEAADARDLADQLGGGQRSNARLGLARDVDVRTRTDPRIAELDERMAAADGAERGRLRTERDERWKAVRAEKLGELAAEFDAIHNVSRAVEGRLGRPRHPRLALRAELIDTIERGVRRAEDRAAAVAGAPTVATPGPPVEARAV